jgi:LysR family transcriptional regulator, cyn operon transcriptional activator
MDVRALRYSLAIARFGSFTRAAESLHVAQPALSVAIKKLEAELGVTLFVRKAHRVEPTVEGRILLARAERIFTEMDAAIQEIADAIELRSGVIRLGMPPMFGLEYFPNVIAQFHAAYPKISITVFEGSADFVGGLLDSGGIDIAMIESRRVRPQWKQVQVGREEMVLCVAPGHPLAKRKSIAGSELDGLPMALFNGTFIQREILDKLCKRGGAKPRVVLQSNSVALIRRAVADGLGAATLLRSLAAGTPPLVALSFEPKEILRFSLCWRDENYLSKANRALVDFAVKIGKTK